MAANRQQQQQQQQQPTQPMTLEEIEREMMKNLRIDAPPAVPQAVAQQTSGYQQGQFPPLGSMPSFPGAPQGMYPRPMDTAGQPTAQQGQFMDSRSVNRDAPGGHAQGNVNPDVARLLGIIPLETGATDEERMNAELEQKIKETELAEMKRRRKVDKIASMSRYNGIMTQGGLRACARVRLG